MHMLKILASMERPRIGNVLCVLVAVVTNAFASCNFETWMRDCAIDVLAEEVRRTLALDLDAWDVTHGSRA